MQSAGFRVWMNQAEGEPRPHDHWQIQVITPLQGEQVLVHFGRLGFPPLLGGPILLGEHDLTNANGRPSRREDRV